MSRPALLRRRSIWVPTVWGSLLALVLALGIAGLLLRHLHGFLAPNAPVGAEVLVVEGWIGPDALREVPPRVRAGGYRQVVTTGGRVRLWGDRFGVSSYAELARQTLIELGLEADDVIAVPAPDSAQDRTYLSAVRVRMWAAEQTRPPRRLDVLSGGVHSRRTWRMYRLAFGDSATIGIHSTQPVDYDAETWWQTSSGARDVLSEAISWLWSVLFFHPPAPGSEEELWGDPATIRRWRAASAASNGS